MPGITQLVRATVLTRMRTVMLVIAMNRMMKTLMMSTWMIRCAFCWTERREQYKCPRCNANYCSLRCYRCERHSKCSEGFYKECVKEHLEGRRFERNGEQQDKFEERMRKYLSGEVDEIPGASSTKAGDDECEPLDSDDEADNEGSSFRGKDEQYLEKVVTSTIDDYVLDEDEIDRRLLGLGIGGDVEQLMGALNEEERVAFARLAEEVHLDTSGLTDSCFKKS
ncbi:hypothetical protein KIN20_015576 [Parelaphostrongylus tenuis]|uniref:HIT-type domain-containing protein n=1 Tax=Parelaphostrongylus tenuis TaxID=148309 RepID=A0AAD5QQ33_PARTN|nr:hypothetical protein KIN20_015576 [Parelaphostrongylus tenuis]